MLIKIKSRTSGKGAFKKLLQYMFKDERKLLFPGSGDKLVITHNMVGDTIHEWEQEFLENERYRQVNRVRSVIATHEVISFHPDDQQHLTIPKMRLLAESYIRKRGPKGMYVICAHFDRANIHLHACVSGITFREGKSMRLSKAGLREFQTQLQELQLERFPELSASKVDLSQDRGRRDKEYWVKKRGETPAKEYVWEIVGKAIRSSTIHYDFIRQIENQGLRFYARGSKSHGITYKEKKYRIKTLGLLQEWRALEKRERERNERLKNIIDRNPR